MGIKQVVSCRPRCRAAFLGLVACVLAGSVAIKYLHHTPHAQAQSPTRRAATAKSARRPPTAQPQGNRAKTGTAAPQQIVAVVNGEKITRLRLSQECIRRFGQKVLESELNKRLILQACQQHGVKITATEVEDEIDRMARKFGLSRDQWLEMLQDERGISPHQYRRDIIWPTLALRRLATDRLHVTDADLRKAFESEYGAMVQVRLIAANSQAKAERLRAQAIAQPDKFDVLAKDQSEDENSAAARGLIPPVRRHVGDPKIEQLVFSLKPGQISQVLPAAGQFLVFKCERHLPPRELDDAQRSQVLAQLKQRIADQKLRSAGSELFKQLQARAEIVNVYNDPQRREKMPDVAALINGQPVTLHELGEQCILRHGREVLEGEINRALLLQALKRRSARVSEDDIQTEVRRAAEAYGFVKQDGTADVDRWLKNVTDDAEITVDVYVRDAVWPTAALKRLVGGQVNIAAEELQKGFLANYGPRVEVLAVVLSNQRTAHKVFDLARKQPTDEFFGELSHQYSIEPVSRANFGQVPPIRLHGGQPLIEKEAFRLKPGEISGVLAMGDKFIVLRCLGRTKPIVDDISLVKDELAKDIREKKLRLVMTREFERLRESAQIDDFLAGTTQSGAAASRATQASYQQRAAQPAGNRASQTRRR